MKVTFYRTVTNERGDLYRASILTVEVPTALSKEQALIVAAENLTKELKVSQWQDVAESYEFH